MSQENPSGKRGFVAGEALEAFRRVKLSSTGTIVYADKHDPWIGTTQVAVASGAPVTVWLRKLHTRKMISASSASAGARAYADDDGKVDDVATKGPSLGTYLDAPSAAGIAAEILMDDGRLDGIAGLLTNVVAGSTAVTASAAATTFSNGSKTINGDELKAGDILRIKAAGLVGTAAGSETVTVQVLVNTEVVATTGAVDPVSGDIFRLDLDCVVRVAGASGKLYAHGTTAVGTAGTVTAKAFASASELSEDISGTVTITVKVTNSSTGESVTLEAFSVELVRQ